MRSTLDDLQQLVLAETEWLTAPLVAALVLAIALLALLILTSMTLPTDPRRAVSRRARLHRAVLSKISSLSAWITLAFACLAVWRLLRLSAEGPSAALAALRSEQAGLVDLTILAGCLAIAFAARWHRELIAGATHFTAVQAMRCQAFRLGFLAAPLLLVNLFSLV
jgi:hypothetical protein